MRFLVAQTYSIVTPESAEIGDAAEHGGDWTEVMGFRQTVEELRSCVELSSGPIRRPEDCIHVWVSREPETDWRTGESRQESIHVKTEHGSDLPGRVAFRLFQVAGLIAR